MRKNVVSLCVALVCVSTMGVVVADPPPSPATVDKSDDGETKKDPPVSKPVEEPKAVTDTEKEPAKASAERELPKTCTYSTYSWHVKKRRAVRHKRVKKTYSEVTDAERDPSEPRCTVCREDQVEVTVERILPVTVCWVFADEVRTALTQIREGNEFRVEQIEGYRVGKTRGPVARNVRTVFSNHSYGTAIDINRHDNGLYNPCNVPADTLAAEPKRIKRCRLRVGGRWKPLSKEKTTITKTKKSPGSHVYHAFKFWKWGGDLSGRLKDFMHFSIDGK